MRILVTGASGQLGGYLVRELRARGVPVTAWSGSRTGNLFGTCLRPVDLADADAIARAFADARPDIVLHAGALARVADCWRDPHKAELVNARAASVLADLAGRSGSRLVFVSTDLVFDGDKGWYREADAPRPLSVYGQTKVAAEHAVLTILRTVVVRLSLLFGPGIGGRPTFFDEQVAALREGRPCNVFEDEWRTPLGLQTAAAGLLAVAESDFTGLLHLGGPERMTRAEMARRLAGYLRCDSSVLVPISRTAGAGSEPRPRDTSLDSSFWRRDFPDVPWPSWDESLRALMS
jgi:dTDP-4-dehydrorhamnose reductase